MDILVFKISLSHIALTHLHWSEAEGAHLHSFIHFKLKINQKSVTSRALHVELDFIDLPVLTIMYKVDTCTHSHQSCSF